MHKVKDRIIHILTLGSPKTYYYYDYYSGEAVLSLSSL